MSGRLLVALTLVAASTTLGATLGHATPITAEFDSTGALQSYQVPSGICALTVTAQGGSGIVTASGTGRQGGKGAVITATVPVSAGDRLTVVVGGAGTLTFGAYGGGSSGGGGGASVVATSEPVPLVVAGGGGGSGSGRGGNGGAIGANGGGGRFDSGGGSFENGGTAGGTGGNGGGADLRVTGGGGGVQSGGVGGHGFVGEAPFGTAANAGNGGGGNLVFGGGGGGEDNLSAINGGFGGGLGSNQTGATGGGGLGTVGGGNGGMGGGGGGIGFGGGGQGGGGAGWGAGGGYSPSGTYGAGGGSSHVVATASNVASGLDTGEYAGAGHVTIAYDPETDACPGTPGAPAGVAAVGALGAATVSFDPPTSDGGSAVTHYTVTATPVGAGGRGGQTATGSSSPIVVDGLSPGDSYTFTVIATNAAGGGLESAPSPPTSTLDVPAAPTTVAATVTGMPQGTASVAFTPPTDDGGSAITGYSVSAIDATVGSRGGQGREGATSPLLVTGLRPGDRYRFVVRAINAAGASDPSPASKGVTPPVVDITSPAKATFEVGVAGHSFQAAASGPSGIRFRALGALPRGLAFSGTGLLSGTPTTGTHGTYSVTLVAISGLATDAQAFTVRVVDP
jgi:hypothetical protein